MVRVAAGVFAPGHLGELTQVVPFELVDAVLAETGRVQHRVGAGNSATGRDLGSLFSRRTCLRRAG
ncbi:transposase domain-containing protein [Actinoallomurus sp. NPDC050550]|uniref:transposase domain-containing protein n=1 Tax=Actinoallomurus sp. NPDC050550 TaxID=3154937 RepID=UPI0033DF9ADA